MAWGMIVSSASLFGMLFLALYADQIEESIMTDQGDQGTESAGTSQKDRTPQNQPAATVKRAA